MTNGDIKWSPEDMLEVTIKQPDDFLKVRETLTRIGVASRKDKTLFQSCHILHKQGKYFIVHFKELFALDGKKATLSDNDIQRRNTIAVLLADWNLIDIVKKADAENKAPLSQIKKRKNGTFLPNITLVRKLKRKRKHLVMKDNNVASTKIQSISSRKSR